MCDSLFLFIIDRLKILILFRIYIVSTSMTRCFAEYQKCWKILTAALYIIIIVLVLGVFFTRPSEPLMCHTVPHNYSSLPHCATLCYIVVLNLWIFLLILPVPLLCHTVLHNCSCYRNISSAPPCATWVPNCATSYVPHCAI